jgi:hypothetical protein
MLITEWENDDVQLADSVDDEVWTVAAASAAVL